MSLALIVAGCTQSKVKLGEDDAGSDSATRDGGSPDSGGEVCGDNTCGDGEYCCNASCGVCAPIGGACTTEECLPLTCADGTVCGASQHCCPGAGCDDGFYCADEGEGCVGLPVECPNVCPDDSTCGEGSECCPGCGGYFCASSALEMCPIPDCPPPPVCDGVECGLGQACCGDCAGGSFCGDICPLCPDPGCSPQDARGVGACEAIIGYVWDGIRCTAMSGCSCDGADCDALFDDVDACNSAHWSCLAPPPCGTDGECAVGSYCDGCATSSCAGCDDCVAGCVPHSCTDEGDAVCAMPRPDCGPSGTAVVRGGCWQCVDLATCAPIDDCRAAGCPDGGTCSACAPGEYVCLAAGMACAL